MAPAQIGALIGLSLVAFSGCTKSVSTNKQEIQPDQVSPAFQEQARRAADAIFRFSAEADGPSFELRKLDAEKAIDEAKYNAQTKRDQEVLKILRTADTLVDILKDNRLVDDVWKPSHDASFQCQLELRLQFEPDGLNDAQRAQANEHSCLSKYEAVGVALDKENLRLEERIRKLQDENRKRDQQIRKSLSNLR